MVDGLILAIVNYVYLLIVINDPFFKLKLAFVILFRLC